ncbi:uncharacterized protein PGTG_08798 [Puccinia graminis f. sp. tritici CRL 75-36-700-3]|uniref:Uncharacterized protein n=1 Tax=Puccinia graminis f. sp. tritici (strain CRL 75-36-700-3 / race SCCL) TaxID=418459 RepID=E3KE60_PUCGT|nr:uncharacterized protein PGTG_08798 [Puccinia graminis f. sp. tritici CRL 75-36-700-3]EFP82602.2 hypothetical protein PGTG_08798 [Puccinia graminis f. sp. tritici CRL 75-36-700-3]
MYAFEAGRTAGAFGKAEETAASGAKAASAAKDLQELNKAGSSSFKAGAGAGAGAGGDTRSFSFPGESNSKLTLPPTKDHPLPSTDASFNPSTAKTDSSSEAFDPSKQKSLENPKQESAEPPKKTPPKTPEITPAPHDQPKPTTEPPKKTPQETPEITPAPHDQSKEISPSFGPPKKTPSDTTPFQPPSTPPGSTVPKFVPKANPPKQNLFSPRIKLKGPTLKQKIEWFQAWNRARKAVNTLANNVQGSLKNLFKVWRQRWGRQFDLMLARLKTKYGDAVTRFKTPRAPARSTSELSSSPSDLSELSELRSPTHEAPELPIGPDAQVRPRPVFHPKDERFPLYTTAGRRPPTNEELAAFNTEKDKIIKAFKDGDYGYQLGNGDLYTVENLAKLLDERMPPKMVMTSASKEPVVAKQPYKKYLKMLSEYSDHKDKIARIDSALEAVQGISRGVPRPIPAPTVSETKLGVISLIGQLDEAKLAKFEPESEAAVKSLGRTNWKMPKPLESYFPDLLKEKYQAIDITKFSDAREIQLAPKNPGELANPTFSTAEEVIHALPADFDATTELYRYTLIKGFEKVLDDVRPSVKLILDRTTTKPMQAVFKKPSLLKPQIEAYINKLGETDFQRLHGIRPSQMFEKLSQPATPADKIKYALTSRKQFLAEDDFGALELVGYHPQLFRDKLDKMIIQTKSINDPKTAEYLKTLQSLRDEAFTNDPANHAYVEKLFEDKFIDATTRAKLNQPGISQQQFLEALGTQEGFSERLMTPFKQDLLATTTTPHPFPVKVDGVEAHDEAKYIMTQTYLEDLDKRAKSFYLTKDAFEAPNSMKFDQAIEVYDPKAVRKYVKKPDPDLLAKAYVEFHLPRKPAFKPDVPKPKPAPAPAPAPVDKVAYKSRLDKFFSEINRPASPANDIRIPGLGVGNEKFRNLDTVDRRLAEFIREPLTRYDYRLIGTPWEKMPFADRVKLNDAAKFIFRDLDKLIEEAASTPERLARLTRLENQLNDSIPGMLEIMQRIRQHANRGNGWFDATKTEAPIDTINQAYRARMAKLKALEEQKTQNLVAGGSAPTEQANVLPSVQNNPAK